MNSLCGSRIYVNIYASRKMYTKISMLPIFHKVWLHKIFVQYGVLWTASETQYV